MSVDTSIIVRATAKGQPSGIIRSTIPRRADGYTLNPSSENLFEKVSEGGLDPRSWWYIPESGIHHHSKLTQPGAAALAFRGPGEAAVPGSPAARTR